MKTYLGIITVVLAIVMSTEACVGSQRNPSLSEIEISNLEADYKFHLENKSELSEYKLTLVMSWNISEGVDYDGILVRLTDSESQPQLRKRRFIPPPPPPVINTTPSSCNNKTLWTVDSNGTSVECQVPCKGILSEPCLYSQVCAQLANNFTSLPKNQRKLEMPIEFGRVYRFKMMVYKEWSIGHEVEFKLTEIVSFCRHELITNHKVDETLAHQFCSDEQDIAKNTYFSGPPANLEIFKEYRDMSINRGVVELRWSDPHDLLPNVTVLSYAVFASKGEPNRGTVFASEKSADGNYTVLKITNIKFGEEVEVRITPYTDNCDGCTNYGFPGVKLFKFSDIDACKGDNITEPYCHSAAICHDFPSSNESSASCTCGVGYEGNGIAYAGGEGCVDYDACAARNVSNHTCHPYAFCKDLQAPSMGANCSCPADFVGDGYRSGSGCTKLSLIIALGVGLPAVALVVVAVLAVLWKMRLYKKRQIEKKMSHFFSTPDVNYTSSISKSIFMNKNTMETQDNGVFGKKWELDRNSIELKGVIGRGNFGVVYRGLYTAEGEEKSVAVKMTPENPSESIRQSFLAEISLITSIGLHENLIGMIGCCTAGDPQKPIYLVSQFMKYGDLLHFLWDAREESNRLKDPIYNLTELGIYHIAAQVANGMQYLSENKFIHGDIAARNILVDEGLKCKISDFGLANDVYRYGMIKGAAEKTVPLKWVSPERMMAGKVPITWRSDVWSFGILLYEAITLGASPYPEIPRDEIFDKLKSGYRMKQPESCSLYLYNIMLKCWEWKPLKRPTFKQLVDDMKPPSLQDSEHYVNIVAMVPTLDALEEEGSSTSQSIGVSRHLDITPPHQNGDLNGSLVV
ncbi:uncharacterized protein LOC120332675 [Styela clava]